MELDQLRAERALAVEYLKFVEERSRYLDHGLRMRTIETLKQLGEWASE